MSDSCLCIPVEETPLYSEAESGARMRISPIRFSLYPYKVKGKKSRNVKAVRAVRRVHSNATPNEKRREKPAPADVPLSLGRLASLLLCLAVYRALGFKPTYRVRS